MAYKARTARLFSLSMYPAFCLMFVSAQGWGQMSTTGTISGTVSDSTGAVVPQAAITVLSEATRLETHTTSNDSGGFVVPGLAPGPYDVTVTKQGFQTYKETGILVSPAQVATINVVLKLGAVATTISVEASAARVEISTPEVSSQVSGRQAVMLPLNGRNYEALAFLMPGVTNLTPDTGLTSGGFLTSNTASVNGMGASGTMYYLDGIWNENTGDMTSTTITPNPDTIEEVRLLQNNYGAQYSLNGSNVMLVETKAGTSTFHGSAYEYLRNDALDARNFFSPTVPALKQNIFGYTIGGPLMIPGHYNTNRQKTFFFWSQQWQVQHIGNVVTGADATADQRSGTFTTPITDPLTGQPFPQVSPGVYQIPQGRLNPDSLALLNALAPLPNNPAGGFLNYINVTPTINNTRDDEIKVDHNFSSRLRLMAEYLDSHQTNNNATQLYFPAISPPFSTTRMVVTAPEQLAQIRLTQILSPSMVNTTSVSMNNYVVNLNLSGLAYRSQVPNFSENLPFNGVNSDRLPEVDFSGGWPSLGVNYILPIPHASDLEDSLSDDWSWLRGNHYLQAGMQYVRGTKRQTTYAPTAGDWSYSGLFTGNPMADYLLGDAATFTQQSNQLRPYEHYPIISPYFQDRWKVNRRLTLTIGLRYSFEPLPNFQTGLSMFVPSRFDPAKAPIVNLDGSITATPNYDPLNGIVFNGITPGIPPNFSSSNQNYWNPTFGFAYDIFGDGKTSLRGGIGVTHVNNFYASCQYQCADNYPVTVPITLITPSFPNPIGAAVAPTTVPSMVFNDMPLPETGVTTFSMALERELGGGWLVSIAGAGNAAEHLNQDTDLNQPYPEGGYDFPPIINTGTVSRYAFAPFQGYGQITYIQNNLNADWDALEINVRHAVGHNLFLSGAYTWQHSMTENRGNYILSNTGYVTLQDVYHPTNDKGSSNATPPQMFALSAIWTLPWYKGTGWKHTLLGGWQYADVTTIQSGFPLDPGLATATPGLAIRPDRVANDITGPKTVQEWFNTNAFAAPAAGFFGNAGPGIIPGPGCVDFDMAFYKDFKIGERQKFQFRGELFNIFNHTNFNGVATAVGAGDYGQITSARDPRIVEFVLRYEF